MKKLNYFFLMFATALMFTLSSCNNDDDNAGPASTSTTDEATEVAWKTATVNASVNGSNITERGIYYSTSAEAQNTGTKMADSDTGEGSFSVVLTDLSPETTYYYVAYATNANGTTYGEEKSFTTRNANMPLRPESATFFVSKIVNTSDDEDEEIVFTYDAEGRINEVDDYAFTTTFTYSEDGKTINYEKYSKQTENTTPGTIVWESDTKLVLTEGDEKIEYTLNEAGEITKFTFYYQGEEDFVTEFEWTNSNVTRSAYVGDESSTTYTHDTNLNILGTQPAFLAVELLDGRSYEDIIPLCSKNNIISQSNAAGVWYTNTYTYNENNLPATLKKTYTSREYTFTFEY